MNTYPAMNEQITDILRWSDNHASLYAAARIEELEAELDELTAITMKEYFVVANSFAAPFFSYKTTGFVEGATPQSALLSYAESYTHPAGLYAAAIYDSATAYHKQETPLARWLSNHAVFMQGKLGSIRGIAPGKVEIDGTAHTIENPKKGAIVPPSLT